MSRLPSRGPLGKGPEPHRAGHVTCLPGIYLPESPSLFESPKDSSDLYSTIIQLLPLLQSSLPAF
jgi:hypothetical protein